MFMENHRGFCIFLNEISTISMFMEYHRRFWVVFDQMFHNFGAHFRLSCYSQGKSPTVCIQVWVDFPSEISSFHVYGMSLGLLISFRTISHRFSVQIMEQMRFAGKFACVLHRCPHALLESEMQRSPRLCKNAGVLSMFHEIIAPAYCNYVAHFRLEGEFPFHRRRCLRVFCLSNSMDLSVHE